MNRFSSFSIHALAAMGVLLLTALTAARAEGLTLTHAVGYHSDSGVMHALAEEFERSHRERSGQDVSVKVVFSTLEEQLQQLQDGTLRPDVISTAGRSAMDVIAEQLGLIPGNWDDLLPNSAAPYATAVVLMVRPGNPLNIRDWDDLARADVRCWPQARAARALPARCTSISAITPGCAMTAMMSRSVSFSGGSMTLRWC